MVPFKLGSFNFDHKKESKLPTLNINKIFEDLDLKRVLLFIEGEEFFIDVKNVLYFVKNEDLINTMQIIEVLDKLSSYRFSITSSIAEFNKLLSELKLDLDLWENQIKSEIQIKLSQVSVRITDKQLHQKFISNSIYSKDFENKSKFIFRIESLLFKLRMLDDILKQRIEVLRSIMKRND